MKKTDIPKLSEKDLIDLIWDIIVNEDLTDVFINIIDQALVRYKEPVYARSTGWFYQHTRTRSTEIERFINLFLQLPTAQTRLKSFKHLIEYGEWNNTSFNYCLFIELIYSIPTGSQLSNSEHHFLDYVLKLKQRLLIKIDDYLSKKSPASGEIEFVPASYTDIELHTVLEKAQKKADRNQNQSFFYLRFDNGWIIQLLAPEGKSYTLPVHETLKRTLESCQKKGLDVLDYSETRKLKAECYKAQHFFLDSLKLLFNPVQTFEELAELVLSSVFVLYHNVSGYSLYWFDESSAPQNISLEEYPTLKLLLDTSSTPALAYQIIPLKLLLMSVRMNQHELSRECKVSYC